MKTKIQKKNENHLIFSNAFNDVERKIRDENESKLESYMKEVDNALDKIYISDESLNSDLMLKFLYNQKYRNHLNNKMKKIKKVNSISSIKENNKLFKTNTKFKSRRLTLISKTDSFEEPINKRNKNMKICFNTINNRNNILYKNIIEDSKTLNLNSDNKIKKEKNEISEEESIIKALRKNKIKLLKLHKNKFIKEMKKEKKLNKIDKEIENKTKTLFYNAKSRNIELNFNNSNEKEANNKKSKTNEKINFNLKKNWKCKSTENFNKLSNLNIKIFRNCIKNIKFDQNFSNIIKYVNKQRLSQYKINNFKDQIKSEEEILNQNKKLLKNQSKEVNFHKRELIKKEKKEKLYNLFKKQIKERFIHKNLKIDVIAKVSNKFAYFGRNYFLKNFNYNYLNDKDFLFENNLNSEKSTKNNSKLLKVKSSCDKVLSKIEKLAKEKKEIMKRIKQDEEKYNNSKNGYYFSVDNKDIIKRPLFSLSRNGNNYSDNHSYDEKTNLSKLQTEKEKLINEIFLPRIYD